MEFRPLLLILLVPISLFSQKTETRVVYHAVDHDTISESNKNSIIKEKYQVLQKNKHLKHGTYQRFSKMMDLLEEGTFQNNKKVGIWTYYKENGCVKERYDFDEMLVLAPEILTREIFRYPRSYTFELEQQDTMAVKFGEVVLDIEFDARCELLRCTLLKPSYEALNRAAVDGFKEYVRLMQLYRQDIPACKLGAKTFKVVFE